MCDELKTSFVRPISLPKDPCSLRERQLLKIIIQIYKDFDFNFYSAIGNPSMCIQTVFNFILIRLSQHHIHLLNIYSY